MFRLLKNPNVDFMRSGRLLLGVSSVLVVVAVAVLAARGINWGIEFTGGTELQVKYAETPNVGAIRDALERQGITSQTVTTIGDAAENEIYIRLAEAAGEGIEGDLTTVVSRALRTDAMQSDRTDLNIADESTLKELLRGAPGLDAEGRSELAAAMSGRREELAIFHDMSELETVEGMTPEVMGFLEEKTYLGPLAIRSQSYIGPAVGRELMRKALLAVLGSLVGMLLYIWWRFQIQWGFAAVVALTHDTLLTLGLFSLFQKEMSLPVVAAFLTLVGYSVNDTVVVFDRIRENVRNRTSDSFQTTVNVSINQTLSRTIITSGLTWIVVFALFLFGGAALNPFAFVLTVGVIVGTYSSIYIASPILVLWRDWRVRGRTAAASAEPGRRAKKVRRTS